MTEIRQLIASSAFSDLDRHFAAFIEAQAGGEQPLVALAAALVSRKRSEGHICLDLEALAGSTFPDLPADGVTPIQLPRLKDWTKALSPRQSSARRANSSRWSWMPAIGSTSTATGNTSRAWPPPSASARPTCRRNLTRRRSAKSSRLSFPPNRARPSTGKALPRSPPCAAGSASSPAAPAPARPTPWC